LGQQQIEDASELIVLCANTQACNDRPERYWANTDENTQNVLVPMLQDFYRDKPQMQRDECMRSCGLAAQTLMLGTKALNYDTCPMIGFDHDAVADIIKLPEDHIVGMIIVMGKAAQTAHERGGQLPLSQVLLDNTF
jgi:nitroreductase